MGHLTERAGAIWEGFLESVALELDLDRWIDFCLSPGKGSSGRRGSMPVA